MKSFPQNLRLVFILLGLLPAALHAESELLTNGDLQNGEVAWVVEKNKGAEANVSIVKEAPGDKSAIKIEVPSTNTGEQWLVSLKQEPLNLIQGKTYHVSFQMKASEPKYGMMSVKQATSPWGKIAGFEGKPLSIKADWEDYAFDFTAETTETSARFYFTNLNQPGVTWYVANLSFKEVASK